MTDPRAPQYGQPPWPPQPSAPPRRKSRGGWVVAFVVLAVLAVCVGGAVVYGLSQDGRAGSDVQPANVSASAVPPSSAAPSPVNSRAIPGVDLGAGTPNAGCASDRLGKWFEKDGVIYTCKGPAPYKWRP